MVATTPATITTNVSVAYTGTRATQSQAAGGDFRSALADTGSSRDRGQSATSGDREPSDASQGTVTASDRKAATQNDTSVKANDGAGQDSDEASPEKALVPDGQGDGASPADVSVHSGKDVTKALAELVAALQQGDGAAPQDGTVVAEHAVVENATKTQPKDQTKVAAEQLAAGVAAVADDTKPVVKSLGKNKGETADLSEHTDSLTQQKDAAASVGVQDALSLLGQTVALQAAMTTQQDVSGTNSVATPAVGEKLKNGLDGKVKLGDVGKTADAATQSATHQTMPSSAADALHMVTSGDHKVSAGVDDSTTAAEASPLINADKLQGVDVLDSRRIIAPIDMNNGANIAATMTGDSEWSSVMRSHASSEVSTPDTLTTDKTLNTLTIKMTPESLGTVTASLKLVDGELSVSLVVENASAYRKLHEDHGELMKSLKAQGLSVDQIQISIASPDKSTNDPSQNNNQNQTNNQSQAQQNSNGQNQGSHRQQAQASFEHYGQASGGLVDDTPISGGSGAGNSSSGAGDQLYL